ncbi:hypothetical protein Tco_0936439 [Tanacetum coccineum]
MPFGLKNARATYQRLVDTIFKGQIGRNLEAYVDDMVIKSNTELEMIKEVEETLLTLKKTVKKILPRPYNQGYHKQANMPNIEKSGGNEKIGQVRNTMMEDNPTQVKIDVLDDTLAEG